MAASRFSVGRKTIIKVYDELERRGLVVRRRGAGTALTCKPDAPPRQTFLDAPLVVRESAGLVALSAILV